LGLFVFLRLVPETTLFFDYLRFRLERPGFFPSVTFVSLPGASSLYMQPSLPRIMTASSGLYLRGWLSLSTSDGDR
jgi:hypothetical protein